MKVLMITPDYPPFMVGGIGNHAYNLVKHLASQNCKFVVIVAKLRRISTEEFSIEEEENIKVIRLPHRFPKDIFHNIENIDANTLLFTEYNSMLFPLIYNLVIEEGPFDLIHVHDSYHGLLTVTLKETLKIPLITTIHSLSSPINHINDSVRRFLLHNSEQTIAVSNWLKDSLVSRYAFHEPIKAIYNGIDTCNNITHFYQKHMITFCGRLDFNKGSDLLIYAFKNIDDANIFNNLQLQLIGDGKLKESLEKTVKDLNIEHKVKFLGYKEHKEVIDLLKISDIIVIPSRNDAFPLIALEAIALGIPVIASAVGGLVEIIKDGCNGMLVQPDNIEELTHALIDLLENRTKRDTYSLNALKTANRFSWPRIAEETLKIYISINNMQSQPHK